MLSASKTRTSVAKAPEGDEPSFDSQPRERRESRGGRRRMVLNVEKDQEENNRSRKPREVREGKA